MWDINLNTTRRMFGKEMVEQMKRALYDRLLMFQSETSQAVYFLFVFGLILELVVWFYFYRIISIYSTVCGAIKILLKQNRISYNHIGILLPCGKNFAYISLNVSSCTIPPGHCWKRREEGYVLKAG